MGTVEWFQVNLYLQSGMSDSLILLFLYLVFNFDDFLTCLKSRNDMSLRKKPWLKTIIFLRNNNLRLMHSWSGKALKGTNEYQTWHSMNTKLWRVPVSIRHDTLKIQSFEGYQWESDITLYKYKTLKGTSEYLTWHSINTNLWRVPVRNRHDTL